MEQASSIYAGQRGSVRSLPWSANLEQVVRPGAVVTYARMICLPPELVLEGWPFDRWSILGGIDGSRFEYELRSRGWQLRRWSSSVNWGIGFSYDTALSSALRKLASRMEQSYRNAFEVKKVLRFRFMAVHVVNLFAHPLTVYWSREHIFNYHAGSTPAA